MRVVDLDRDMSDVIPTGATPDSQFLFDRMTRVSLDLLEARPGRRLLDVASGFGQDAAALARRGADVIALEPSARMTNWARMVAEKDGPRWVRGWSDALPFASERFDGVVCKGAIDHFDRPAEAIAEMARVTRTGGRVVLAIANFESLACRLARLTDRWREPPRRGRRHYDVPADHFTRYDLSLMREQAARSLEVETVCGISLGWGLPLWARAVQRLPSPLARGALQALDAGARRAPAWADVVVLAGRPRRARSSR
ncbi:MAG TPA: methyltransferase domain-containing protein [Myxococcota bacterium]|nr:methyltransferase domain-containing protein [Myxococcota bacterium]